MKKKVFIVFVIFLAGTFFLLSTYNAIASSCDDVYIVYPPNNEGGTFYLSLEADPETHRFPRAGYIQAMTLIKLVRKNGKLDEEWLSEKKYGVKYLYREFVGSDGSYGYIKDNSIKSLTTIVEEKNQFLDCRSKQKLVVPIHPIHDVIVYNEPDKNFVTPSQIHSFSRSNPDVVFTNEELDYWYNEDHSQKIPYFKVRFSQKKPNGKFEEQSALVKAADENKIYRFFPVNPSEYIPFSPVTNENFISKIRRFFERSFTDYNPDEFARMLKKSCMQEYTLQAKLKVGASLELPYVPIGVDIDGSIIIRIMFPRGYRYTVDCYQGLSSGTKNEVLKTICCEQNSEADWYIYRLTVNGIGKNKKEFNAFQHQLETRLGTYFEKPDTTGRYDIKREYMLVLKTETGLDYFTAFSKLSEYLDQVFFDEVDLSTTEREQFKSLIMRLIVDCRR